MAWKPSNSTPRPRPSGSPCADPVRRARKPAAARRRWRPGPGRLQPRLLLPGPAGTRNLKAATCPAGRGPRLSRRRRRPPGGGVTPRVLPGPLRGPGRALRQAAEPRLLPGRRCHPAPRDRAITLAGGVPRLPVQARRQPPVPTARRQAEQHAAQHAGDGPGDRLAEPGAQHLDAGDQHGDGRVQGVAAEDRLGSFPPQRRLPVRPGPRSGDPAPARAGPAAVPAMAGGHGRADSRASPAPAGQAMWTSMPAWRSADSSCGSACSSVTSTSIAVTGAMGVNPRRPILEE